MIENNNVRMGYRDGMPIGVGYFAMSFAFGLFAVSMGISPLEAVLISMFNLTSAGQIAAVPIITAGASLVELALTQIVINARYALMSISLSQRLGDSVRQRDRFWVAFFNTDEIFAVSCAKGTKLGKKYLFAVSLLPYLAWSLGTLFGAIAGNVLPEILVNALSVSLYAMFVAILIPSAKLSRNNALCILSAIAVSCAFYFIPLLKQIHTGVVIIISTVAISALFAIIAPIKDPDPWCGEEAENV